MTAGSCRAPRVWPEFGAIPGVAPLFWQDVPDSKQSFSIGLKLRSDRL